MLHSGLQAMALNETVVSEHFYKILKMQIKTIHSTSWLERPFWRFQIWPWIRHLLGQGVDSFAAPRPSCPGWSRKRSSKTRRGHSPKKIRNFKCQYDSLRISNFVVLVNF